MVTVERFSTEEEAMRLGNDALVGLAGAVWTLDAGQAERGRQRALRHGEVWMNDYHPYLQKTESGAAWAGRTSAENSGPPGWRSCRRRDSIYHNKSPAPAHSFSG